MNTHWCWSEGEAETNGAEIFDDIAQYAALAYVVRHMPLRNKYTIYARRTGTLDSACAYKFDIIAQTNYYVEKVELVNAGVQ